MSSGSPPPDRTEWGTELLLAARLEQLARIERGRRDSDHRLPATGRDASEGLSVLEVGRRPADRLRAPLGVARLEDAGADEDAVGAELHAERSVGGRSNPAGRERHDR